MMSHRNMRYWYAGMATVCALAFWQYSLANDKTTESVKDRELRVARRQTKMLDTLYKTAIISVTQTYVQDDSSTAAITTFQPVLKAMQAGKWHEVKLIDGLGDPINPDNAPKDAFEKMAIQEILKGKEKIDVVETIDGKQVLRTMTILPMALDKCVLCHENYRGKKIVGGVSYQVPLDLDIE